MNELEQRMASILDELGVKYHPQYEVGSQYYPPRCCSKYPCSYGSYEEYGYEEETYRECELGEFAEGNCEWCLPRAEYSLYVLDFAVFLGGKQVDIECDGFDYHYRAEWQWQRDRERDNWLQNEGWIVKRYSGSIITSHRRAVKKELSELFTSPKSSEQPNLL